MGAMASRSKETEEEEQVALLAVSTQRGQEFIGVIPQDLGGRRILLGLCGGEWTESRSC
jgi:hypothetical protein